MRRIARNLIEGIKHRYPLCCILGYCLGNRALKNGVVIREGIHDIYIPCWFHRGKAISLSEHMKRLDGRVVLI